MKTNDFIRKSLLMAAMLLATGLVAEAQFGKGVLDKVKSAAKAESNAGSGKSGNAIQCVS